MPSRPPKPAPHDSRDGFELSPSRTHAALSAQFAFQFSRLRIGATLVDERGWHALHSGHSLAAFERQHGVEDQRGRYDRECIARAFHTRKPVIGEHTGFCDVFVPVVRAGRVEQCLVSGSFLRGPPTSAEVMEHWRAMTNDAGHLGDSEFAAYLSAWLEVRELDARGLATYRRLVALLAELIAGEGDPASQERQLVSLLPAITEIVRADLMWNAAKEMVDLQTGRAWFSHYLATQREELNLQEVPTHALVGLVGGARDDSDPVDEMIRRRLFQRACARWAFAKGNMVSGPVGDHGVAFLVAPESSERRTQSKLIELGDRATQLARSRFRLKLHIGFGGGAGGSSLPLRYESALAAAEMALATGQRSASLSDAASVGGRALRDARTQIAEQPDIPVGKLAARFDRYLELVAVHCGYRIEPATPHMESGFEALAAPFLRSGALEHQTFDTLCDELTSARLRAKTLSQVLAAYRQAAADLELSIGRPFPAQRERNLRRAVAYIREHAADALTLDRVARIGGFAPAYFSRLFKQRQGVTLERYIAELRLERAKQMLARTSLSTTRIAQLVGFASSQYFHRVFRSHTGLTPLEYRRLRY
jgi:AraC-like DNA-binding protein